MKRISRLIIGCALAALTVGCEGGMEPITFTSADERLGGDLVTSADPSSPYYKIFVLNEGAEGGTSTLDFFRFNNGIYVRKAFSQMNPDIKQGLGKGGNDMRIFLNSVWAVMTDSDEVVVFNAVDETHIKTISIPSPRNVVFDMSSGMAFISSYEDATPENGGRNGSVYKVSLKDDFPIVGKVEVGYQPEGMAVCYGKLFVANSGCYMEGIDDRLMVVDMGTFKVTDTITVAPGLKHVVTDGQYNVWVGSMGDGREVHSSLHRLDLMSLKLHESSEDLKKVRVTDMEYDGTDGNIYVIGTDDEFDEFSAKNYNLYRVGAASGTVSTVSFSVNSDAAGLVSPSGVARNAVTGEIYITDSRNNQGQGLLYSFSYDLKTTMWWANAGIGTAHPIMYAIY